jgi:mannosyltransferase OCH1-like enzyme
MYDCRAGHLSPPNATWSFKATCYHDRFESIPNYIHTSWRTDIVNVDVEESWKSSYPSALHKIWAHHEIDHFVRHYYPQEYEYFKLIAKPSLKIDVFRLMVVATFGGVWVDIETHSHTSIQQRITDHPSARMVVGLEAYGGTAFCTSQARPLQVAHSVYAAVPQHQILHRMIRTVVSHMKSIPLVEGRIDLQDQTAVMDFAGPGLFTDIIFEYLREEGHAWWRNWVNLNQDLLLDDVLLVPS